MVPANKSFAVMSSKGDGWEASIQTVLNAETFHLAAKVSGMDQATAIRPRQKPARRARDE